MILAFKDARAVLVAQVEMPDNRIHHQVGVLTLPRLPLLQTASGFVFWHARLIVLGIPPRWLNGPRPGCGPFDVMKILGGTDYRA